MYRKSVTPHSELPIMFLLKLGCKDLDARTLCIFCPICTDILIIVYLLDGTAETANRFYSRRILEIERNSRRAAEVSARQYIK